MRGHGKCAAGDEIRRRVLLDEQRRQADQNHQRKGCQPQRLVRTQRQTEVTYTAEQFLLYDTSADQPEYAVRLYYPDRDGARNVARCMTSAS